MTGFKAVVLYGRRSPFSLPRFRVSKLFAYLSLVVVAACASRALASDDNNAPLRECTAGFVNQGHANPATAEQACRCLFQELPPDIAAKVAVALVTPDDRSGYGEAGARTLAVCRAKACSQPNPTDDTCDFDLAWKAEARGDHVTAIEQYSRFIKARPDLPAAISNRGRIYLEIGSYDLAISDLEKAVAIMGSGNSSDLYLAHAYHLAGRDRDAAAIIDKAVQASWFNPYSSLFRAEIREAQGRRDDAIADYREALKKSAGHSDIRDSALAGLKRLGG